MGKRAPSPPPPPDPVATARAQAQMNRETAITQAGLNMTNQTTPFGTLTWRQIGTWEDGTPRFEAVVALSPEEQAQLARTNEAADIYGRAAVRQLGQVEERLGQPFAVDFSALGNPNVARDAVQEALMERLRPELERNRASLETRLRNQGLLPGSEAWNAAMADLARQEAEARIGAVLAAGQEQSRMLDARQRLLAEALALRTQPLNEATALLTGQLIQQPQFVPTPQTAIAPPDYQGAVRDNYAAQMAAYQAQQQARAATFGGLAGLGGALLGSWIRSDARAKVDVRRVGSTDGGLPIYLFRYADDPARDLRMGVMAQDVERVLPGAVREIGGVKHVDYEAIT